MHQIEIKEDVNNKIRQMKSNVMKGRCTRDFLIDLFLCVNIFYHNYGFVCIIAVLYPWYYTVVLYSSLKPNEYYTVQMNPLRSPNESDVESVEFRLQRIRGLLACYKV